MLRAVRLDSWIQTYVVECGICTEIIPNKYAMQGTEKQRAQTPSRDGNACSRQCIGVMRGNEGYFRSTFLQLL